MENTILLIEPYYTGSHKVLVDILLEELSQIKECKVILMSMPGKKWHWRARTSALYFAQNIPKVENLKCIFTSCVLPLHELIGLRPDLSSCKKIVYFHENQLVYPVRKSKDRDFQYGYNQIMTCLGADLVLFNSKFNQDSFLKNLRPFFNLQPDCRPKDLREQIEPKCQVLYFPLKINMMCTALENKEDDNLRIVWPHRWEFDKNPDMFFNVLFELQRLGKTNFRLNVLGESFTDNPPIFDKARAQLADFIDHFGYVSDKAKYHQILMESDIVISTANHEFFGVAMLEGVCHKCFPLAPNDLVYPEIFPFDQCLYKTEQDLLQRLATFLDNRDAFKLAKSKFFDEFSFEKYTWNNLQQRYVDLIVN